VKAATYSGALVLALTMASFPASAEWVKVAQTSTAIFYVDNATIVKADTQVKVWHLIDLKETSSASAAPANHQSAIGQSEYDCALHKYRNGYSAEYAGSMGSGLPIRSIIGSRAWAWITPDSVEEKISAFACGRP
jgi:hypothetical protein